MSDVEQIHDLTAKISRNHTIILASFDNNGTVLYKYCMIADACARHKPTRGTPCKACT